MSEENAKARIPYPLPEGTNSNWGRLARHLSMPVRASQTIKSLPDVTIDDPSGDSAKSQTLDGGLNVGVPKRKRTLDGSASPEFSFAWRVVPSFSTRSVGACANTTGSEMPAVMPSPSIANNHTLQRTDAGRTVFRLTWRAIMDGSNQLMSAWLLPINSSPSRYQELK